LYFATIVHECIRMGDFVEMITHSATVNHGGGLRKTFERAWANPVHHAHVMYAPFFNATPVALKISCGAYDTKTAYHGIPKQSNVPFIDALAALDSSGAALHVMLVHRCATSGPITVSLDAGAFGGAPAAEFLTLSGESMTDQNTFEAPDRIAPRRSTAPLKNFVVEFLLAPYSMTRITLTKAK
jgi:alpha-L-arabinofuranosidase